MPIFWVHGFTDPLFPSFEPLTVRANVLAADPTYPFKLFLGDVGHDYSGEMADAWDRAGAHIASLRKGGAQVVEIRGRGAA